MHYVITGATGFLGHHFVSYLLTKGERVTVLIRDRNKIPSEWYSVVDIVETDMCKLAELISGKLKAEEADYFVHFAWAGTSGAERSDEKLQLQNVMEIKNAVALATHLRCRRFFYAGSIMEYEAMNALAGDGFRPAPGMIYSSAKLLGDFWARTWCNQCNIEYVCAIISNIYGPGEKSERFLNTLIRKMLRDEDIDLTSGEQPYDFIYISDAMRGIYLIINHGKAYSSYYLGNTKQYALKEFVLKTKEILNSKAKLNFGAIPFNGVSLAWDVKDTEKLKRIGFYPQIPFEEGIVECRNSILKESSYENKNT